jgi:hypothetical protein
MFEENEKLKLAWSCRLLITYNWGWWWLNKSKEWLKSMHTIGIILDFCTPATNQTIEWLLVFKYFHSKLIEYSRSGSPHLVLYEDLGLQIQHSANVLLHCHIRLSCQVASAVGLRFCPQWWTTIAWYISFGLVVYDSILLGSMQPLSNHSPEFHLIAFILHSYIYVACSNKIKSFFRPTLSSISTFHPS